MLGIIDGHSILSPESDISLRSDMSIPYKPNLNVSHPANGDNFSLESTFTPSEHILQEPLFPEWKNSRSGSGAEHPDEMQRRDPLATQIWKLYSRTKASLPNQERMENLTWRMMAMNLKRKERESARQTR